MPGRRWPTGSGLRLCQRLAHGSTRDTELLCQPFLDQTALQAELTQHQAPAKLDVCLGAPGDRPLSNRRIRRPQRYSSISIPATVGTRCFRGTHLR